MKNRTNIFIDKNLKRKFKAICGLKGLSMEIILNQIISDYVKKINILDEKV